MWIYKKETKTQMFINSMQKSAPALIHISRILLAAVFIFSGFVKAIDPLGFTYKIDDYLMSFGGIFTSFTALSLPTSIVLSTLEFVVGLNLLFQIQFRKSIWMALLFMIVMTPLTLYIAIYNPVSDCGCFGDALVITNWQTFFKNLVLIVIVVFQLIITRDYKALFVNKIEWSIVGVFAAVGIALSVYSYNYLPIIDFRPYKIGTNIPEAMFIPEDAKLDEYKTTFIYEKNGLQKEFSLENYPKGDSTWKFIDQKTILVSKGYKAPIHDFSIVNGNFEDITEDVIYATGSTYLLVMYDLTTASEEGAKRAELIYQKYKNTDTKFYALTASGDDMVRNFKANTGVSFPFCKTDPITLKTIVRANPGLVLIKNAVIVNKWHWHSINEGIVN